LNVDFRWIIALSIGLARTVECGTLKTLRDDNDVIIKAKKGKCQ
jgi:hypothetical protein